MNYGVCKCCGKKLRRIEFVSPEKEKEFMSKYGEQFSKINEGEQFAIPDGYFKYVTTKNKSFRKVKE